MAESFGGRLRHAWNAFTGNDVVPKSYYDIGPSYGYRPDRIRFSMGNERSIVSAVYTRIGIDAAVIDIRHVRVDENERYLESIDSGLNYCLTQEANIDQASRAFVMDMVQTLCERGVIAIVPVDTSLNPNQTGGFDIQTLRVAEIIEWYPRHVKVRVYNDRNAKKEELVLPKSYVAIVENPLYNVMNEPNSTLQRLIRKLNMLDAVDEQSSSGKLDLIIQLPYTIKSDLRKQQAEERRKNLEVQLKGSQYGIAYADATEKITQLNRPAENNLLNQVTYLTTMLYGQLGITEEVILGKADEATMLNYYNRTIEPILAAIAQGMSRTFLTKTARSQGQRIKYFRDPFKLVSMGNLADIADKFTRNEILSSNDMRAIIGMKPSKDPNADALRNKNLNQSTTPPPGGDNSNQEGENQNGTQV